MNVTIFVNMYWLQWFAQWLIFLKLCTLAIRKLPMQINRGRLRPFNVIKIVSLFKHISQYTTLHKDIILINFFAPTSLKFSNKHRTLLCMILCDFSVTLCQLLYEKLSKLHSICPLKWKQHLLSYPYTYK